MTPPGTDNPLPKDTTQGNLQADIDSLLKDVAKSTERIESGLGAMPGVGAPLESDAETAKLAAAVNGLLAEKPAAKPEALTAIENLDAQLAELTAQLLDSSRPPPAPVVSDVEAAQAVVNQGVAQPPEPAVAAAQPPSAAAPSHEVAPQTHERAESGQPVAVTPDAAAADSQPPVAPAPVSVPPLAASDPAPMSVPPPPAAVKATPSPVPGAESPTPPMSAPSSPVAAPVLKSPSTVPDFVASMATGGVSPAASSAAAPSSVSSSTSVTPVPSQPAAPTGAITSAESAALAEPLASVPGEGKLLSFMAAMSKPLQGKPKQVRAIVGLFGIFTITLGLFVWAFVILRPPPKATESAPFDLKEGLLPRPVEAKVEDERSAAKGGHEGSSSHEAPKSKAKSAPKKEAPKKDAHKKAEPAQGGGH